MTDKLSKVSVELLLAPDSIEGDVVCYDKQGKRVETPHRIEINPYFFGAIAAVNLAYFAVKTPTHEVSRAVAVLSGATGRIRTIDRTLQQQPKFLEQLTGSGVLDLPEDPETSEDEA